MRGGFSRLGRPRLLGLFVLGGAWVLTAAPALGQVPQPKVSDIHERSGLIRRFIPIETHLPPDPRRDSFYDTRFGDHADTKRLLVGGLAAVVAIAARHPSVAATARNGWRRPC